MRLLAVLLAGLVLLGGCAGSRRTPTERAPKDVAALLRGKPQLFIDGYISEYGRGRIDILVGGAERYHEGWAGLAVCINAVACNVEAVPVSVLRHYDIQLSPYPSPNIFYFQRQTLPVQVALFRIIGTDPITGAPRYEKKSYCQTSALLPYRRRVAGNSRTLPPAS